jgi:hypothetical protein
MSVRYLSTRALAALRDGVPLGQTAYVRGRADTLLGALSAGSVHESRIPAGEPPSLLLPDGGEKRDSENVRLIHQARPSRLDTAKLASFNFGLIRQCPGACSGVVYFLPALADAHEAFLRVSLICCSALAAPSASRRASLAVASKRFRGWVWSTGIVQPFPFACPPSTCFTQVGMYFS